MIDLLIALMVIAGWAIGLLTVGAVTFLVWFFATFELA